MKKSLLSGILAIAAVGATLGGACLATGNCQAKSTSASTESIAPIALAAQKSAPEKSALKTVKWFTSLDAAKK